MATSTKHFIDMQIANTVAFTVLGYDTDGFIIWEQKTTFNGKTFANGILDKVKRFEIEKIGDRI